MPILSALLLALSPAAAEPATLVVFRDHAEPVLFSPTLWVDGVAAGKLGQRRLIALALPAGRYRVELRWPAMAGQPPASATLVLEAGKRRVLELRGVAAFGLARAASDLVEHDDAAAALACCRPAR